MSKRRSRLLFMVSIVLLLLIGIWGRAERGLQDLATPGLTPNPADIEAVNRDAPRCANDPAGLPPPTRVDGRKANYLHTCGSQLFNAEGKPVLVTGLNWNGMENDSYVPDGLGVRRWQEIMDQIASLGYNTIRLPFTNEALDPNKRIKNVNFTLNPDLEGKSGLETLDQLITGARDRGLKIILVRHRPTPGNYAPLWHDYAVPEEKWIADWQMLATRYYGDDTVIGFDLTNEPRGPTTWGYGDVSTDWRLAAERAGNAVLTVNPYLLILVEGIEYYRKDHSWWGGDLQGVRTAPVRLNVPGRVVYSPHDYGPNISDQPWFHHPDFPNNLPEEWDRRWGYIQKEGIGPILVGEFGGRSVGNDPEGLWQRTLLSYLQENGISGLVWSLNPNWDTGGILGPDWHTVEQDKQNVYSSFLAPPLDSGATGIFGKPPSKLKVYFKQEVSYPSTNVTSFSLKIFNDGPTSLDLGRVEVRYWLNPATDASAESLPTVSIADTQWAQAFADLASGPKEDQTGYIRLRFPEGAYELGAYQLSKVVTVRWNPPEGKSRDATGDFSFAAPSSQQAFHDWERVTLYLDGNLVWGQEPR